MRRIRCARETLLHGLELFLPFRARSVRLEGRGYCCDVLDVAAQRFLLRSDGVQTAVDAARQSPELLLCEPPFFSSKFRSLDMDPSSVEGLVRLDSQTKAKFGAGERD